MQAVPNLLGSFGLDLLVSGAIAPVARHGKRSAHTTAIKLDRPNSASPMAKAFAEGDGYDDMGASGSRMIAIDADMFILPKNANERFRTLLKTYHITAVDRVSPTTKPRAASEGSARPSSRAGQAQALSKDDQGGRGKAVVAVVKPQWLLTNTVVEDYY